MTWSEFVCEFVQCDVCRGTGTTGGPDPCICGGSGLAVDAVVFLRGTLDRLEWERDKLLAIKEAAGDYIGYDQCGALDAAIAAHDVLISSRTANTAAEPTGRPAEQPVAAQSEGPPWER